MTDKTKSTLPDNFDRTLGQLVGLPDVVHTRESTHRHTPPLGVGGSQLFVVQTYRQRDIGDTIFLEHVSEAGTVRLVIPPKVAELIARQRDQLTTRVRSKTAKAAAQDRKRRGIQPGFLKAVSKKDDQE